MKTEESKYSLEKWQHMERDYRNGNIPELNDTVIVKGYLPYHVYLISTQLSDTPNYLNEVEYQRILKEQVRAFDKRLELGLNYTFTKFAESVKELPVADIEARINDKINIYNDAISKMDLQLRNNVADGEKRPYGIDYTTYNYTMNILSNDLTELAGYHLTYEADGQTESNVYLDLWVWKGFIKKLQDSLVNFELVAKDEEQTMEIGRPPEFEKQTATDYFDENKKELIPLWHKSGGKTNVAKKIHLEAYKDKKKPHPQTIVGYIKNHLNSDSEK